MTGSFRMRVAAAAVLLIAGVEGVAAGPMPAAALPSADASSIVAVQYYGYGYRPYGYGYRPYYRPYGYYRPYAYGPGPRYYRNHFGPGAAKERYRTRLDFCKNQPARC